MNQAKPVVDPDEMFPQVEKLIYSLAHRFSQTYPLPFDDAKSEAYYAFVRACYDFQPGRKMKFSSWCYYWVWTRLKDVVTARTVDPHCFMEMTDDLVGQAPANINIALEMFDDLSTDAKEIIALLIETPADLVCGQPISAKSLLPLVKTRMRGLGRSHQKVELAVEEIRLRLRGTVGYCVA